MNGMTEAQTAVVVTVISASTVGLLGWATKKTYRRIVSFRNESRLWKEAVNRMIADHASLRGAFDSHRRSFEDSMNSTSPGSIKDCLRVIMDRIEKFGEEIGILRVLRSIDLDRQPEPTIGFCRELKMNVANKAALDLLEVKSFDDLRGYNWKDVLEYHTAQKAFEMMQDSARDMRPCTARVIVRRTKTDGRPLMFYLQPVISPDGHKFCGFTGTVVDLETKHAEALQSLNPQTA